MRNYEKPVVLMCEDIAEGVYAASGSVEDPECWSIAVNSDQQDAGGYHTFRVEAHHNLSALHISERTRIEITFTHAVTNAEFEGFVATCSGNTVELVRETHGNSYASGDQYNSLLKIWSDDYKEISVVKANIFCTHKENVQGQND